MKELESRRPEAVIRLGPHAPEDAASLNTLEVVLLSYLNLTTGRVYAFSESALYPESLSEWVTEQVDKGRRPSRVYLQTLFALKEGRRPNRNETTKFVKEEMADPSFRFTAKELKVFDRIQAKLKRDKSEKRFGLLVEGLPDSEYIESVEVAIKPESYADLAVTNAFEGNFDEAVDSFKEYVLYMAENSLERESRIASKIGGYLQKDDTEVVVATLGGMHTGVARKLKQNKHRAETVLVEKEGNTHYYNPEEILERKCMLLGEEHITELEWYQGLLDFMLFGSSNSLRKEGSVQISRSKLAMQSVKAAQLFYDFSTIRKFESEVRKYGFFQAIDP